MGGNYEKGVYSQLMEVMEKLNTMESENNRICTFINSLSGDKFHLSTGGVYGFC